MPSARACAMSAALAAAICSQPRDGLALSTAFRHLSLGLLGYTNFFLPHYATHPMALYVRREDRKGSKDQALAIARAAERDQPITLFHSMTSTDSKRPAAR